MGWFEVDKDGLAKLIEKRGKHRAVFELIQNAWDQNVTSVQVALNPIQNKPCVEIVVTDDDPEGFMDLSHAFTMFAESNKKGDPGKRGRFNLGEKLVLALCNKAEISSTKGTVVFDKSGRRTIRKKTDKGSIFRGEMRMTREELDETRILIRTLLPPIKTLVNAAYLRPRRPLHRFECTLPTEIADDDGYLRRTSRKTIVEVYEPRKGDGYKSNPDEKASIYEMGIPVVETGDKYHINVLQKVPLNTDRDNVTPSYLQTLRTLVFNEMHDTIDEEEANSQWVRSATSDERCNDAAMDSALTKRFGKMRVIYDPSDPEANHTAYSKGYTVITGSQLNKTEWKNVKDAGLAKPAGQVTPTNLVFTGEIPAMRDDELADDMKLVRQYAIALAEKLMKVKLRVSFLDTDDSDMLATYGNSLGDHRLTFYVRQLGENWFDLDKNIEDIDDLLIHEFGHEYSGNHLDKAYHDALSRLGARLKKLALDEPQFFAPYISGCQMAESR